MYARTRADDMVVNCIRELLRRHPELPPERVDDVAVAATTQIGDQGLTIGRMAALHGSKLASVTLEEAVATPNRLDEEVYRVAEVFFG